MVPQVEPIEGNAGQPFGSRWALQPYSHVCFVAWDVRAALAAGLLTALVTPPQGLISLIFLPRCRDAKMGYVAVCLSFRSTEYVFMLPTCRDVYSMMTSRQTLWPVSLPSDPHV